MIHIITYSDKSIAVYGDTYPLKDDLKRLGGRFNSRLSCGPGWVFPKNKLSDVAALINGKISAVDSQQKENLTAEIETFYKKVWADDRKMIKYCMSKIGHVARLSNGLILKIEKPEIKKSFCFGESGDDYSHAVDMAYRVAQTEDYFKSANLRKFDSIILSLNNALEYAQTKTGTPVFACTRVESYYTCSERVICDVFTSSPLYVSEVAEFETLGTDDIKTALELYNTARAAFEKRLNNYWSRYGASQLRTWTYYRDA